MVGFLHPREQAWAAVVGVEEGDELQLQHWATVEAVVQMIEVKEGEPVRSMPGVVVEACHAEEGQDFVEGQKVEAEAAAAALVLLHLHQAPSAEDLVVNLEGDSEGDSEVEAVVLLEVARVAVAEALDSWPASKERCLASGQ